MQLCSKVFYRGFSDADIHRKTPVFYYVGNIVLDISGISTKVSYDNMWRSHFCSLIGNINLNRRTKNTHKMGMGNFKESAGMLKNTL